MFIRSTRWLAALGAVLFSAPAFAADAKEIVEKAIEASGGKEMLKKYAAQRSEFKGTISVMGLEVAFTGKSVAHPPERERTEMTMEVMGQTIKVTQVVNGDKAKVIAAGMEQPLMDAQKEEMQESARLAEVYQLVTLLDGKNYEVKAIDNAPKVDDRETMGITVSGKGLKETKLFFDKKTGLLAKMEREGLDPAGQKGKQEMIIKEHKKFDGIQTPVKFEIHHDGKKFLEMELTSVKYLEKVDAKEFDVSD
jgi:hypothetical protein